MLAAGPHNPQAACSWFVTVTPRSCAIRFQQAHWFGHPLPGADKCFSRLWAGVTVWDVVFLCATEDISLSLFALNIDWDLSSPLAECWNKLPRESWGGEVLTSANKEQLQTKQSGLALQRWKWHWACLQRAVILHVCPSGLCLQITILRISKEIFSTSRACQILEVLSHKINSPPSDQKCYFLSVLGTHRYMEVRWRNHQREDLIH